MSNERLTVKVERVDELEAAYFDDATTSLYQSYESLTPEVLHEHDSMRILAQDGLHRWWSSKQGESEWVRIKKNNDAIEKARRGEI